MIQVPAFANPFAEPGELQNLRPLKPRIHRRFGIWGCTTRYPFVYGCGYKPEEAYREWERILREKIDELPIPAPTILSPVVLCELAAAEVE